MSIYNTLPVMSKLRTEREIVILNINEAVVSTKIEVILLEMFLDQKIIFQRAPNFAVLVWNWQMAASACRSLKDKSISVFYLPLVSKIVLSKERNNLISSSLCNNICDASK